VSDRVARLIPPAGRGPRCYHPVAVAYCADHVPARCVAPLEAATVGQYVETDPDVGTLRRGRVEQVDAAAAEIGHVGVRWDDGRLGWIDAAELRVDAAHTRLCGEPATEERVVSGVTCSLCAAHAAELDGEAVS
jgi:hypothetical protein